MAERNLQDIVVIGTGYVGLPLAIMLARSGYKVIGVDINREVVRAINEGILHIKEEDLKKIFEEKNVTNNLIAKETPCDADVFIIAVPTPLDKRKKVCDMSYVNSAVDSIIPHIKKGNLVIIESTVPPLTCREVIKLQIEKNTGLNVGDDVYLAHCPERILPGNIFYEIVHNDRIIGGLTEKASKMASEVYGSFVKGNIYLTDDITAELCKLAENTYRDVNIALANEIMLVSETLGIDAKIVIGLANKHPRVKILNPGIGVGGHCIPIDPWFIKEIDPDHTSLIFTARQINDRMPYIIAAKIRKRLKDIINPKIIVLGMAYKPETYDLRESPALEIIKLLQEDGYDITAYDPLIEGKGYESISNAAKGADCIIVLVEHKHILQELRENEDKIKKSMKTPLIITLDSLVRMEKKSL